MNFSKGDIVTTSTGTYIVMAKLSSDAKNPTTYNICTIELLHPQFGVSLDSGTLVGEVSEEIRARARNFI